MIFIANNRVKQAIMVQLFIAAFFAISLFNMVSNGNSLIWHFPCLVSIIALLLCGISSFGLCSYKKDYYVKIEKDYLYYSRLSLKKSSVYLPEMGGYILQNENLTLVDKKLKFICEIRSCYLQNQDFEALVNCVANYNERVYPLKKKTIISVLLGKKR